MNHKSEGSNAMVKALKQPSERGQSTAMRTGATRCRRAIQTTAAAVLAGLALVSAGALNAVVPAAAATGVVAGIRTDWRGPWSPQDSGAEPDPWPSPSVAETPVSKPATTAQAAGVVLVDTVLPYQDAMGAGTGMVLTTSGQVLTNYHVVQGAGTISVTVAATGKTYRATVVGSDQTDDVALLQLSGASGLATVKVDHDQTSVHDRVTAVGNAGGTGELTAATGRITSLEATVTTTAEESLAPETLTRMVETTADVVPGDSGGPLYDSHGEAVGIDTAASTGSEIDGYAIPIQRALKIVNEIRSGTETSTVRIGPAAFLGVTISNSASYDPYYPSTSVAAASGAMVGSVMDDTAAARAGIQAGDLITNIGGRTVSSAEDLSAKLATHHPGTRVQITWTDQWGDQHTAEATLGVSPVA